MKNEFEDLDFAGIELDIDTRWERGVDHHPKSIAISKHFRKLDELNDYSLDLRFGGDGDPGENILYVLDIIFEAQDKKKENDENLL